MELKLRLNVESINLFSDVSVILQWSMLLITNVVSSAKGKVSAQSNRPNLYWIRRPKSFRDEMSESWISIYTKKYKFSLTKCNIRTSKRFLVLSYFFWHIFTSNYTCDNMTWLLWLHLEFYFNLFCLGYYFWNYIWTALLMQAIYYSHSALLEIFQQKLNNRFDFVL